MPAPKLRQGKAATDQTTENPIGQQSLFFVDENLFVRRVGPEAPLPVDVSVPGIGDAFGRLRVSEMRGLQALQSQYNEQPIFFDQRLVANATITHLPDESSVSMDVTADAGSRAVRQTRQYMRYDPGKSLLIRMTPVFGAAIGTVEKRTGYFDDENGVYFRQLGDTYAMVMRSSASGSVVDTVVEQADWNIDTFDGLGKSEITLDGESALIVAMDMAFGGGEMVIGFQIDGMPRGAHQFDHSNVDSSVFMSTPNLPARFEIIGDDANVSSMKAACISVDTEGGEAAETALEFVAESGTVSLAAGVETPIFGIRPRLVFNGQTNRSTINPQNFHASSMTEIVVFRVYYDPTSLTGATWADRDKLNSAVEFATFVAGTIAGGIPVKCLPVPAAASIGNTAAPGVGLSKLLEKMPFTVDIDGADQNELIITAENLGLEVTSVFVCAEWEEIY